MSVTPPVSVTAFVSVTAPVSVMTPVSLTAPVSVTAPVPVTASPGDSSGTSCGPPWELFENPEFRPTRSLHRLSQISSRNGDFRPQGLREPILPPLKFPGVPREPAGTQWDPRPHPSRTQNKVELPGSCVGPTQAPTVVVVTLYLLVVDITLSIYRVSYQR